jgi:muramidase (phage lysozyme)
VLLVFYYLAPRAHLEEVSPETQDGLVSFQWLHGYAVAVYPQHGIIEVALTVLTVLALGVS